MIPITLLRKIVLMMLKGQGLTVRIAVTDFWVPEGLAAIRTERNECCRSMKRNDELVVW